MPHLNCQFLLQKYSILQRSIQRTLYQKSERFVLLYNKCSECQCEEIPLRGSNYDSVVTFYSFRMVLQISLERTVIIVTYNLSVASQVSLPSVKGTGLKGLAGKRTLLTVTVLKHLAVVTTVSTYQKNLLINLKQICLAFTR